MTQEQIEQIQQFIADGGALTEVGGDENTVTWLLRCDEPLAKMLVTTVGGETTIEAR